MGLSNLVTTSPHLSYEWLRGKVIQVQNSIFFCLCLFGKAKYIEIIILKYLSHSSTNAGLIIQHLFFHFQNYYFSSMVKWSKSISLYRDILTWISLPLRYTENGCWNVIEHPLCGSVCAMPIITNFLLEKDDETLDSFYTSLWQIYISKFQKKYL